MTSNVFLLCFIVVSLRPDSGDESAVLPDGAVMLRVHAPAAMPLRVTGNGVGSVAPGSQVGQARLDSLD